MHAIRTDEQTAGLDHPVLEIDLHARHHLPARDDPCAVADAASREIALQEPEQVGATQAVRPHLRAPERFFVDGEQQAVAVGAILAPAHARPDRA